jgi:hypothetical protein
MANTGHVHAVCIMRRWILVEVAHGWQEPKQKMSTLWRFLCSWMWHVVSEEPVTRWRQLTGNSLLSYPRTQLTSKSDCAIAEAVRCRLPTAAALGSILWWPKWYWDRFSTSTLVSQSTICSTIIVVIMGWYMRPNTGCCTNRTQSHPTSRINNT